MSDKEDLVVPQVMTAAERQVVMVEAAQTAALLVKSVLEIARVRAQSQAEIDRIAVEKEKLVAHMREETIRLAQVGANVTRRGEAAVALVTALTQLLGKVPEADVASRTRAIEMIAELGRAVVSD